MNHLFIVGVGRSGTTLIQSILNAHSDISFTPESHFLFHYLNPSRKVAVPKSTEELLDLISKDQSLQRIDLDFKSIVNNLKFDEFIWSSFFHSLLLHYAKKEGVNNIGDKDPMNSGLLNTIKKYFPEASVIHIIREPRDVLLSRLKSTWGKKYPILAHLGDHKVSLEKALREGPSLFGEKYSEIRYEDLISNTEKEIKILCKKLNIQFEIEMLDFSVSSEKLVSKEERQWKGNIFGTIMTGNKYKWKKELTGFKKDLTEFILKDLIIKLGYEKPSPSPFYILPFKLIFAPIELYFKRKYRISN